MGDAIDFDVESDSSVDQNQTISVTVNTHKWAREIVSLVDDTSGNDPAAYDLTFTVNSPTGDSIEHDPVTNSTSRSHVREAIPQSITVELTNVDGDGQPYRLVVVSYSG